MNVRPGPIDEILLSDLFYRRLLRSLPDTTVLVFGQDMRYRAAEGPLLGALGIVPDRIIGKTFWEVVSGPNQLTLQPLYQGALNGQTLELEIQESKSPHTVNLYLRLHGVPISADDGHIMAGMIVVQDITAQKQAETALRDHENLLYSVVEQSHNGIVINDAHGRVIEWNTAQTHMTGLAREDVLGKPIWDVVFGMQPDGDRSDAVYEALKQDNLTILNADAAMATPHVVERDIIRADGQPRTMEITRSQIQSETGNYLIGVTRDITEQRRTLEALTASEEKFRAFFEQSSEGITMLDDTGRVVEWNKAREDSTGLKREAVLGQFFWDVQFRMTPPQWRDNRRHEAAKAAMIVALQDDQAPIFKKPVEGELFTSTGTRIIQQKIFPVRSGSGFLVGSISRDITDEKLAERRAFDLALEKERVQLLRHFIEKTSHEFRTPLAVINAALFFAANAESLEKRQSKAATIEAQVWRMTRLIDMLLTMARLDSNEAIKPHPVNINQVLNEVQRNTAKKYGEKPALHWEWSPDSPFVLAETDDLTEALTQLLDNAYRFTPPDGLITVTTGIGADQAILTIRDTGSGISEADLPHIFETFWRKDEAHTIPGFGLGLPIARTIVGRFGGTLRVESVVGVGSTFTVLLPVAKRNMGNTD